MTKLFKKSLACVVAVVLCLSAITCGFLTSADTPATIEIVSDADIVFAEDEITLSVVAAGFTDVAGAQFAVDLGGATYVSDNGDDDTAYVESENALYFVGTDVADGTILEIVVAIPDTAAYADEFDFAFVASEYCDADSADVAVTEEDLKVVIAADADEIASAVKDVVTGAYFPTTEAYAVLEYDEAEAKALADRIASIGGEITGYGIAVSIDGADPTVEADGTVYVELEEGQFEDLLAGEAGLYAESWYTGMNFDQFDTDVKFVAVVDYVVDGEPFALDSEIATINLKDELDAANGDSVAAAIIAAADAAADASADDVEVDAVELDKKGSTATPYYNLAGAEIGVAFDMTKAATKAIVDFEGANIVSMGVVAITENLDYYEYYVDVPNPASLAAGNVYFRPTISYAGMNVNQMGEYIGFQLCYLLEGEDEYVPYGDPVVINFIELIADNTDDASVAYVAANEAVNVTPV